MSEIFQLKSKKRKKKRKREGKITINYSSRDKFYRWTSLRQYFKLKTWNAELDIQLWMDGWTKWMTGTMVEVFPWTFFGVAAA